MKSEYLEKYGQVIDFPKSALDMIGKTHILSGVKRGKEFKGLIEAVRFSDAVIIKDDKTFLAIEFQFNNFTDDLFWSPPFSSEILEPKISEQHKSNLIYSAKKLIDNQ
jgi:hypothetical protein